MSPSPAGGGRRTRRAPGPPADLNMDAAGFLYDMAALQGNTRSALGYKRAAGAVIALPEPVADVVRRGALREVPYIGPATAAIVTEVVETGTSRTVAAAVASSGRSAEVEKLRGLRHGFLSHHAMEDAHRAPLDAALVSRACFRGDLQMHSTWSDGAESIATMAAACMALGHGCMGVTDHSHGLPVARGMAMEDVSRQHAEIDRLNARFARRFRIFKGIEANILADGSLDLSATERRAFEFVIASPHSALRRDHDQTARMVAAVQQPGVAMLGHPRGRMFNRRAGVRADWPRVFAEAARRQVAIEIDGNWHRQDVEWGLAAAALGAGCLFALDSDAHSVGELRFTDYAIAHARLAGIPADRVVNCWSDARLLDWMAERRQG